MDTPPLSSQSHFTKFNNFVPNDEASFDDEFSRLASSQEWKPGSQEYVRQRTIAMRDELEFLYFSQPDPLDAIKEESSDCEEESRNTTPEPDPDSDGDCVIVKVIKVEPKSSASRTTIKQESLPLVKQEPMPTPTPTYTQYEELTYHQKLQGFQQLCREVGLEAADDIGECKRRLRTLWVNIIDLIDAKRTGRPVDVWTNWEAFRWYSLDPSHRIHVETAKESEFLGCFLQRLWRPGERVNGRPSVIHGQVLSGRVGKKKASNTAPAKALTSALTKTYFFDSVQAFAAWKSNLC